MSNQNQTYPLLYKPNPPLQAYMRLYELNQKIHNLIDKEFTETYWVTAELSDVSVHGPHCYMEFIEKSPFSNELVAKARGQIWGNQWKRLGPKFEQATGQRLSNGMQVMVCVRVTFSERYGFSLNVVDIDPTYTLGDIAKRRKEIIDKLKSEGVYDLNKELALPSVMNRIAVISSSSAAGYQDFCHQLSNNTYNLQFTTRLFPAVMQGPSVESSVISALDSINSESGQWDVVVIIRGGGATSDLSGFDSYLLGANVAQFTLPVITGIGHERDNTVIDEVSHTRVKTPTAAAEFIINHQYSTLSRLLELEETILNYCRETVLNEQYRLGVITDKFPTLFKIRKEREIHKLESKIQQAGNLISHRTQMLRNRLDLYDSSLAHHTRSLLNSQLHRLEMAESKTDAASPDRLLKLGFSISRSCGKAITDIHTLKAGMEITTTVANGMFTSTVNPAKPKKPTPPAHLVPRSDLMA